MKIRMHMIFNGRVQGVGFRYHACFAARSLGITGWVCNRADGSVEMEAQGSREMIYKMLEYLNRDAYIRVDKIETKNIPLAEQEADFFVKRE